MSNRIASFVVLIAAALLAACATGSTLGQARIHGRRRRQQGRWLYVDNLNDGDISVLRIDGDTVTNTGTLVELPGKPASMRGRTH